MAGGEFSQRNLQGFMAAEKKKKKKARGGSKAEGSEMKKRLPLIMLSSSQPQWMLREGQSYNNRGKSPGPVLPYSYQPNH